MISEKFNCLRDGALPDGLSRALVEADQLTDEYALRPPPVILPIADFKVRSPNNFLFV